MIKAKFTHIAMVGAAAVAMMVGSTAPAMADTNKIVYLPDGRGYIKFIDDGDVFQICDTKADGHGVTGRLDYRTGGVGNILWYEEDGGDSGCDNHPYNIGNWPKEYQMGIKWNGGGGYHTGDWFNE
ncbi:hypothetical protein [Streptomyces sp. NPDC002746]